MKTILFILPNLKMGGAERIITILINSIDKSKYTPKLLLLKKEGQYLDILNEETEIFEIKKERIRQAFFPIIRVIKKIKPDIVFGGWGEISAFLAPVIPLFPNIRFIARETNIVSQHVTRPEIKFFYKFYNNFHTIIAQSDDMKIDLITNIKIKKSKIIKINNPVDFDIIDKKMNENLTVPFTKDYINILSIGNMSKRKGFDNLLKVFNYLKKENIRLYIIGEGIERENLQRQKEENGLENVFFLGNIDNPFPYYKYADLFVLSSRHEGFPNVLLEAGACSLFSIANNCKGGINEIIEEGINGKIEDISKYKNFADEIVKTINEDYNKFNIRQSIKNRFSKEKIIKQYEEVFDKI